MFRVLRDISKYTDVLSNDGAAKLFFQQIVHIYSLTWFKLIDLFEYFFKVYVLEWNNADWWYVRKHLTEESGWVPAQYLKDEQTYTLYVQKKLVEKIEKLPVFDRKFAPG